MTLCQWCGAVMGPSEPCEDCERSDRRVSCHDIRPLWETLPNSATRWLGRILASAAREERARAWFFGLPLRTRALYALQKAGRRGLAFSELVGACGGAAAGGLSDVLDAMVDDGSVTYGRDRPVLYRASVPRARCAGCGAMHFDGEPDVCGAYVVSEEER